GKLRYFFVPLLAPLVLLIRIIEGGYYTRCRDAVWQFVQPGQLLACAWMGLRGFAGAFLWLVLPISLLALGRVVPPVRFLRAWLLAIVLVFLPFAQIHFAARNDLRAFADFRGVWRVWDKAPWACTVALIVTLAFALPLYALKLEMIPREVAWLPSLVFIVF